MCGKFVQMAAWSATARLADVIAHLNGGPAETVTPMRVASVIRLGAQGKREVARMRWGFVPARAKESAIGTQFIHARAETIDEKPTYREAFLRRRGLVMVKTFNEGKEITPTRTRQHTITPRDGTPLAIAVIWERWLNAGTPGLETFAMVTVPANALIGTITDRMPAVITPQDWPRWLGEEPAPVTDLKAILKPFDGDWQMHAAPDRKKTGPANPDLQPDLF